MVVRKPVKPGRVIDFVKPYLLHMRFTNQFVHAQVIHTPTTTVAATASTQEKGLREILKSSQVSTRDVAAAARIGKLLGERLLQKDIPAIKVILKREQKYHGKVKAMMDSVREAGVKLL